MKKIIGIMGPGKEARKTDKLNAYKIGKFCASRVLNIRPRMRPAVVNFLALKKIFLFLYFILILIV